MGTSEGSGEDSIWSLLSSKAETLESCSRNFLSSQLRGRSLTNIDRGELSQSKSTGPTLIKLTARRQSHDKLYQAYFFSGGHRKEGLETRLVREHTCFDCLARPHAQFM